MSYRRNYRRSYYWRKSDFKFFWVLLGILFAWLVLNNIKTILTSPVFYIILVIVVVLFVRKKSKARKVDESYVEDRGVAEINSEKHGCKCYMDGLSYGEQEVAEVLSRELSYKDYFLFNNLIVPCEKNVSTQIDHIVVSKFGIFVIESKDYNGWIFGDKDGDIWTQSLPTFSGRKKTFKFQNPIHQNYAHVMALKTLLPFVSEKFYGIVVFSDRSEFKTPAINNVINTGELIEYIKKYNKEVLTDHDIQLAIGGLSYLCQTVDISAEEHIENLKEKLKK